MSEGRILIASRTVSQTLHEQFANLSGDRNPMHMDPVAARRTQAALPVVHGVHTLLWSLESLVATNRIDAPIQRIQARFLHWTYLGDDAVLSVSDQSPVNPDAAQVEVRGLPVLSIALEYGEQALSASVSYDAVLSARSKARDLSFAELPGHRGDAFVNSSAAVQAIFPRLAQFVGAKCVAELLACTYIVGMECPGLHSLFARLDAILRSGPAQRGLHYEVVQHDERFRKARIAVKGSSIEGTLEVFVRHPPVAQASVEDIAKQVESTEFTGMRALVIGGSRGLGESTAKIIATGGGEVVISYVLGKQDAESLAESLRKRGGKATSFAYDVRQPAEAQTANLKVSPTHLFYFATSSIARPRYEMFSAATYADFTQFYVRGFYDLCCALTKSRSSAQKLIAHYPSSVYVDARPPGMIEYAMAKAAGELLCAEINANMPQIHVLTSRLPRLPTDQTTGLLMERSVNALDTLIPIVREMMRLATTV